MKAEGTTVEIGVLQNIGKNAVPTLDAFDEKTVAYTSASGKVSSLFTDGDTFAIIVPYDSLTKENILKSISTRGYVKMIYANGKSLTYYLDTENLAPQNLFEGYGEALENATAGSALADYFSEKMESCYDTLTVHLNASAASKGNGSSASPFKNFADAFDAAKAALKATKLPLHVVLSAADGVYSVSEPQTLTSEEMAYKYSDFTILSANGGAILTTGVDMNGSFSAQGGNIYTYQFEKDANGNYPAFRQLLVNGERADLAYNGGKYAVTEEMTLTGFDRPFEAVWQTAVDEALAGRLTFTSAVPANFAASAELTELYEYYRPRAIAYAEVVALYNGLSHTSKNESSNTALSGADPTTSSDEGYTEAFALYQQLYLGRYKAECEARYYDQTLFKNYDTNYGPDYSLSDYTDRSVDKAKEYAYRHARYYIYGQAKVKGDNSYVAVYEIPFDKREGYDAQSLGKFYIAESVIGAGVLDTVRSAGAENYKTALTGLGVEISFTFQYMLNVLDLNGVDLNDYYVKNGEKHYAVYLEDYANMQTPSGLSGKYSLEGYFVYAANHVSYLDKNNEYYYDEATGTLYYYSTEGVAGKTFAHASSDYILMLDGVSNVTIKDFSFTGTDDYALTENGLCASLGAGQLGSRYEDTRLYAGAFPDRSAIYMNDVTNALIQDCDFYALACEAITARGWMQDVTVEGNTFSDIGSAAIRFGQNIRAEVEPSGIAPWIDGREGNVNIVIRENYLKDISVEYLAAAIQLTTAYNCSVQYNTIDDCGYTGISVGWQWSYPTKSALCRNVEGTDISYNFVSGFMNESADGGAIYLAGPNAETSNTALLNTVHHNYILYSLDTGDGKGSFAAGLYFDGAVTSYNAYENVIVAPAYGAASGETNYSAYGITEKDAARLTATRNGATYIYLQHITNQEVYNITLSNNTVVNVRATSSSDKKTEVYKEYLGKASGRNVTESGTSYVNGVSASSISANAQLVIDSAGATGHKGLVSDITDNKY